VAPCAHACWNDCCRCPLSPIPCPPPRRSTACPSERSETMTDANKATPRGWTWRSNRAGPGYLGHPVSTAGGRGWYSRSVSGSSPPRGRSASRAWERPQGRSPPTRPDLGRSVGADAPLAGVGQRDVCRRRRAAARSAARESPGARDGSGFSRDRALRRRPLRVDAVYGPVDHFPIDAASHGTRRPPPRWTRPTIDTAPAVRRVVDPLKEFLHAEAAGGLALLAPR
jgi:hypothetical protein